MFECRQKTFFITRVLFEISIEEMKFFVMGEIWSWNWTSRKIKNSFLGIFGLSGLWYRENNHWFVTSKFLYKCSTVNWDLVWGIQFYKGGDMQVCLSSGISKNSTFLNIRTETNMKRGSQYKGSQQKPPLPRKTVWLGHCSEYWDF